VDEVSELNSREFEVYRHIYYLTFEEEEGRVFLAASLGEEFGVSKYTMRSCLRKLVNLRYLEKLGMTTYRALVPLGTVPVQMGALPVQIGTVPAPNSPPLPSPPLPQGGGEEESPSKEEGDPLEGDGAVVESLQLRKKIEPDKAIEKWTVRDFVKLFFNAYREFTGKDYEGESYGDAYRRVHSFLAGHELDLTNEEYYRFVWWTLGRPSSFKIKFGSIVSKDWFDIWRKREKKKKLKTVEEVVDEEEPIELTPEEKALLDKEFGIES